MSTYSLLDCNQPLYHESLRCIASIHSCVVNEGKFDLTMDAFGKWYEYVHEENTCLETPQRNLWLTKLGTSGDSCLRGLCFSPGYVI